MKTGLNWLLSCFFLRLSCYSSVLYLPNSFLIFLAKGLLVSTTLLSLLFLLEDFFTFKWRLKAWRLMTLPDFVTLNLLVIDFRVFCFGIVLGES